MNTGNISGNVYGSARSFQGNISLFAKLSKALLVFLSIVFGDCTCSIEEDGLILTFLCNLTSRIMSSYCASILGKERNKNTPLVYDMCVCCPCLTNRTIGHVKLA